jgi:hypothetical protein
MGRPNRASIRIPSTRANTLVRMIALMVPPTTSGWKQTRIANKMQYKERPR